MPGAGTVLWRQLGPSARRHCQSPHPTHRTSSWAPITGICSADCMYKTRITDSSRQWRCYATDSRDKRFPDHRNPFSSHEPPQNQTSKSATSDGTSKPSSSPNPNDDQPRDEELPSFKAQIWESTEGRIKREREEQERFSRHRAEKRQYVGAVTAGAVALSTIFGYFLGTQTPSSEPDSTASTLPLARSTPPPHNLSEKNLQAAWSDLRAILGDPNISTTTSDLESHAGTPWSSYPDSPADRPFCVVRPATTEEVSRIMKVCHKRRVPIVPYSGGTSLEGHFAAPRGGISIDFSRMDQLLALHADDLDVVVQPALGWETLNDELSQHGLFFPPDPGPGAQIGGMIGTGCSGTNAYRHGTMRDWVVSLTVVLADGTIIKTRQRPRKSSAGYDLTRLLVGSEGTLGIVTEATLKLTSTPQNTRVAVAAFPDVRKAAACVTRIVRGGVPVAAVELLDDAQMRFLNEAGATSRTWAEAPTLFVKFAGNTERAVRDSVAQVRALANATEARGFEFAESEEEAAELWGARKEALWSVMAKADPDSKTHVWTTDVAVPISRLPDIIEVTKADIAAQGLTAGIVGHVGDGNFHAILLYDAKSRVKAEGVVHRMVERAVEMEGTSTGEHGIGLVKRDSLEQELGKETVDAMRMIKKAWDPMCLLNCDKVIRRVTEAEEKKGAEKRRAEMERRERVERARVEKGGG
ncbi:MAG: D-lactate ferricytochrome c oxidoreductase [Alyxoria varia]|nr:MAG: D-lactate ferricytochrome c oxidoreductase [Alyxoria varia]